MTALRKKASKLPVAFLASGRICFARHVVCLPEVRRLIGVLEFDSWSKMISFCFIYCWSCAKDCWELTNDSRWTKKFLRAGLKQVERMEAQNQNELLLRFLPLLVQKIDINNLWHKRKIGQNNVRLWVKDDLTFVKSFLRSVRGNSHFAICSALQDGNIRAYYWGCKLFIINYLLAVLGFLGHIFKGYVNWYCIHAHLIVYNLPDIWEMRHAGAPGSHFLCNFLHLSLSLSAAKTRLRARFIFEHWLRGSNGSSLRLAWVISQIQLLVFSCTFFGCGKKTCVVNFEAIDLTPKKGSGRNIGFGESHVFAIFFMNCSQKENWLLNKKSLATAGKTTKVCRKVHNGCQQPECFVETNAIYDS